MNNSRKPSRARCRIRAAGLAVLAAFPAKSGAALTDPSALCDAAALQAAHDVGIPQNILLAITRVETGRPGDSGLRPWPWAINKAGDSAWFDTAAEAVAAARTALEAGQRNLDVGCFQVNHHWHGDAFPSLEVMFDPQANARYAARFLADLFLSEGGWPEAVAAYHSRTPEHARRYIARIEAVLADLPPLPPSAQESPPEEPLAPRENLFPLLIVGAQGHGGSLVPMAGGRGPLFGGP